MDAAVATAFALGVVEPWMSGIGCVGYMLVHVPGQDPAIVDFSARSPANLQVSDYPVVGGPGNSLFPWPRVEDDRNVLGPLSICAPTMAMGMELGWKSFGSMSWTSLVEPAVRLAGSGLPVDWHTQLFISSSAADLATNPSSASVFLDERSQARTTGWASVTEPTIDLKALRESLRTIAQDGAGAVRDGSIARAIASDVQSIGGKLAMDDFEKSTPSVRKAAQIEIGSGRAWVVDGLSGGSTFIDILRRLEGLRWPVRITPKFHGLVARAGIDALRDRVATLGDCDPVSSRPSCTTSFSVIDRDGMAVSATLTLVSAFGSKVMSPSTGILLNNAISWFDPEPGKPNSLGPSKRCLSNMCPVLVDAGNGQLACVGAAGGRKIVPAVTQVAAYLCLAGKTLKDALDKPRLSFAHDETIVADSRLGPRVLKHLDRFDRLITVAPTVFPYHFAIVTAAETNGQGAAGFSDQYYAASGVAKG